MKRILLFILPILLIVAVAFTFFGIIQLRFTEEKLMDDLRRKARSVVESLEFSVRYALLNNDLASANRIVEVFENRERLQGCAIYDKEGNILSITKRFSDWKEKDRPYIKDILNTKEERSFSERFKDYSIYSYVMPILDEENNALGLLEVMYDTSYLATTMAELWRRLSISLIVLLLLVVLMMLLIHRRIFILPVVRLTEWFQHFQRGETDKLHAIKGKDELGKLASEVEQVALSLRVARKIVSEKASERLQKQELWTETKLKDLIHARLGENALFVVSNREPYMHVMEGVKGKIKCIRPASGVVTALHPILSACGGTWVAQGAGNVDKKFVNSKNKLGVPPEDNRYILKRVFLNKEEEDGYYYGFSNEGLWPLCHNTHTRPIFREADWKIYKEVNQKFAENLLEELPSNPPLVFIQDYHFTLLGKIIKEKRPDATIALFWHIPWPSPDSFAICPYHKEILEGMLGCDLIGFHVQNHCNNFLDTVNRLLESRVDTEKFSVVRSGKETLVRSYPISIDGHFSTPSFTPEVKKEVERIKKEFELEGQIVGLGRQDRLYQRHKRACISN
ncbi:MAG: trehalose-6-phosphate synthase [Candidatus Omnitrophota bacterium]